MNESNPFKSARIVGTNFNQREYRAIGGDRGTREYVMSRSELMEFYRCPSRWREGYKGDGETDATEFGSLLDCMVLEPERFLETYRPFPEVYPCEPTKKDSRTEKPWNRNATYCQEWEEKTLEAGLIPIKSPVVADARTARNRLASDETIRELIDCSEIQVYVEAHYFDEETKLVIPVKTLLDLVPDRDHPEFGRCLLDFKTTRNGHPAAWRRQVFDKGYHVQAAMYWDAYIAATDEDRTDFRHLIVENFAPWEFGRRILSAEFMKLGRDAYTAALRSYCQCLKHDHWPTYDEMTNPLFKGWTITEPEEWMLKTINEPLEFQDTEPTDKPQMEELLA